jgi:leucyl aminopeptidase
MLITKESQEALVHNYIKRGYSTDQNIGFIDGFEKAMELIERIYKDKEQFKKNNMIPTAEEFLEQQDCIRNVENFFNDVQPIDLIEFAKLHVEAALKAASEKATVTVIDHEEISEVSFKAIWGVDDDSILNAYSIENIK